MASTNKTANYELSQFEGTDKPSWEADYNADMLSIDTNLKAVSDVADGASGSISTLADRVTAAEGNISTNANNIDALEARADALESGETIADGRLDALEAEQIVQNTAIESNTRLGYNLARPYDSASTYSVGAYVLFQDTLYKCTTAISTGEAFDPNKWLAIKATDEIAAGGYTLPTASASTLGGVKVGSNLSIDQDGVLSGSAPYVLPIASANDLGGVKVGNNLSIDANGVLSAAGATATKAFSNTGVTIRSVSGLLSTYTSYAVNGVCYYIGNLAILILNFTLNYPNNASMSGDNNRTSTAQDIVFNITIDDYNYPSSSNGTIYSLGASCGIVDSSGAQYLQPLHAELIANDSTNKTATLTFKTYNAASTTINSGAGNIKLSTSFVYITE